MLSIKIVSMDPSVRTTLLWELCQYVIDTRTGPVEGVLIYMYTYAQSNLAVTEAELMRHIRMLLKEQENMSQMIFTDV